MKRLLFPALAVPFTLMMIAGQQARAASSVDERALQASLSRHDWEAVRQMGPGVMPVMARIYGTASEEERTAIALGFYQLGWKSPEAMRVLMRDVHTSNVALRLQVQWALGRVSADEDVVATLLDNMRNDPNPLFRDKSACALAYDQVHLTSAQKLRLYEALVAALEDPKLDVRRIALLALQIHTKQTKGFDPAAAPAVRQQRVQEWQRWIAEFRSQL